jgi:hypothetical protein
LSVINAQEISGKIVDKENHPIEYANIFLLNRSDSTLINGVVSPESGEFRFFNIPASPILKISYLGYSTKFIDIEMITDSLNLGTIILEEDLLLLNEVSISASISPFSRKGNNLIVNVNNSILSSVGTANDVIKRIPGIIEKNKEITVFGKGSPIIYINNRKLLDKSELKNVKSSNIATMELITNPGAEYDAEGRAVLLIKTKRNTMNGWALQATEALQKGKYLNEKTDIGLNYTYNNFLLFASYNHIYDKQDRNPNSSFTLYEDTIWQTMDDLPQVYVDNYNIVTTGMDWSISRKHAVGGQYQGIFGNSKIACTGTDQIMANGKIYDVISISAYSKEKLDKYLINAFYKGEYSKSFHLRLDIDYMKKLNKTDQITNELSSIEDRNVTLFSHSDFDLYAAKLSMTYRIKENMIFEFGGEYNQIKGDGYVNNPEQYISNNIYTNEEKKAAGFLTYKILLGKIDLQVGVRYEFTQAIATEDSTRTIHTNLIYDDFYPNFSFSQVLDEFQWGLTFTRKTKRPAFSQLNSNNYYVNRFLSQKGNPYLKNEDIYQTDFNFNYKIFDFTLGHVYIKDPIINTLENLISNSFQSVMTYTNCPKYQELNALLTTNLKYKIVQSQISIGVTQPFFKVNYLDEKIKLNQTALLFTWSNDITFPKEYIFGINFGFKGKNNAYVIKNNGYKSLDISFRKSFLKENLSLNLQAFDVFKWIQDKTRIEINNISYIQKEKYETRFLLFTIDYKFNNYEKKYREKNAVTDDIRRL